MASSRNPSSEVNSPSQRTKRSLREACFRRVQEEYIISSAKKRRRRQKDEEYCDLDDANPVTPARVMIQQELRKQHDLPVLGPEDDGAKDLEVLEWLTEEEMLQLEDEVEQELKRQQEVALLFEEAEMDRCIESYYEDQTTTTCPVCNEISPLSAETPFVCPHCTVTIDDNLQTRILIARDSHSSYCNEPFGIRMVGESGEVVGTCSCCETNMMIHMR